VGGGENILLRDFGAKGERTEGEKLCKDSMLQNGEEGK